MRRFIAIGCILFSFLSASTIAQPAAAGASLSRQDTTGSFAASPGLFTTPGKVNVLIPLGAGRILAAGKFVAIGGQAAPRSLAIINSDGSLDLSFQVDPGLLVNEVTAAAVQADGKFIIAGLFKRPPTPLTYFLLRLNQNGTVDDTFNTFSLNAQVFAIHMDGDKILIGGNFTTPTPHIARLNQDGTVDPAFNGLGSGPDGSVRGIARQSSGKYILVGEFKAVNSVSQVGVARIHANGSLDNTFAPGGFRESTRVAVLGDDSVLVGGENNCGDGVFAWYTSSGSSKPALSPDPDLLQSITAFLPLPDGGFLIGGWYSAVCANGSPTEHRGEIWRYAAGGSYRTLASFGSRSDILALALRSDGKVMLGGQGQPETLPEVGLFDGLALLSLADDGLEKVESYHPVVGDEAEISSLSRYPDGKLLVAGNFSHVDSAACFGLARLLANGALEAGFHPVAGRPGGWSSAALALPDGRAVAGFGDSNLYLLGTDGSLTDLSAMNNYDRVSALALQNDGKVLVGSNFGLGLRRLNADFSGLDGTFIPGDANGSVLDLAVQEDGKILVAGDFSRYNSVDVPGLVRLDGAGAIDAGFTPPLFMLDEYNRAALSSLAPLANGQVLVGGNFTMVGGEVHPVLVRLDSNGARDPGFSSPADFHTVRSTCVQADGSVWAGGVSTTYFRDPLALHLDQDGVTSPASLSNARPAHDGGVVNSVLCDTAGLSWAGGRFNLIDGRPFYGLARYHPLLGRLALPVILH